MDFHCLTRRDLQALCKKNKIPANLTNVAMADALKALEIAEGIEEFIQPSQSETAQSSIESLASSEATSPYVPPTAGRSTRRRNVTKEELETVNSMTRTRRTTRKTVVKVADESQADAIETPALVVQTNRKKGQMASACRKMDSQLKECAEEDKKDFLMTPAPLEVTSRRRRAEESAVKRVYSTRRSVRLAVKNVKMLSEVKNEESQLKNKELLTKDSEHEEMNLYEGMDDSNELSGITGVDAITNMEENSAIKDKSEVASAQKQDINAIDEFKLGSAPEEEACINFDSNELSGITGVDAITNMEENSSNKDKSEVASAQKQDINAIDEFKLGSAPEEEACINFETEAPPDEEKCDDTEYPCSENTVMPLNVSNEVQQSDGSNDVCTSEIEIIFENSEELNTEKDAGSQDEVADFVENVFLESKDNFAVGEFSRDTGFCDEIEQEFYNDKNIVSEDDPDFNVTLDKFTELRLQQAPKGVSPGRMLGDVAKADSDFIDHLAIPEHLNRDEPHEIEILRLEESEKAADTVPSDAGPYGEEAAVNALASVKNSPSKQHLIVQKTCLTPSKNSASKAAITMKRMTGFSDNKENIGSCSKLVLAKDRVKSAKNTVENVNDLSELSMRKLTKMLKEKLEITKTLSKNEHGNEALPRPALQALPENQLVDETQNLTVYHGNH